MGFWKNICEGMSFVGAGMASVFGYRHPHPKHKRFKHRTYEEIVAEIRRFRETGRRFSGRGLRSKK